MIRIRSRRHRLMLLTACSVASGAVFTARVWAQTTGSGTGAGPESQPMVVPSTPGPVIVPTGPVAGGGAGAPIIAPGPIGPSSATPESYAVHIQKIKKYYHELLLKEKNVTAAISTLSERDIQAAGTQQGSIQSVLNQTPSVHEYQQNIGQNVPVLTVRGVKYDELAVTLNGLIPLQDLLSGGSGSYLHGNIGAPVTLGQLSGTTVYSGVAPPDQQGFATVGGTVAYTTKQATSKPYGEIFGGYGSFNTSNAGFEINTGAMGSGPNAPMALLRFNKDYSSGFPDGNSFRNNDMLFDFEKPYDDGLSHFSATVIYNQAYGYLLTFPGPVPQINATSYSYNFPHSLTYSTQTNAFLTAILHDETYINPHLILEGSLFYLRQPTSSTSVQRPDSINYNPSFPYQITFQVPYLGYGNVGPGNYYYLPPYFTYDPVKTFGSYAAGESAETLNGGHQTIGFTPRANIFLPYNDIIVGALIAKEMSLGGGEYFYGGAPMPQINGYNSFSFGGGSQRTIYSFFLQDKINLLHDKLHIQPGVQLTGVYSSVINAWSFSQASAANPTGNYKLQNFGKQADPYLGASYDLPDNLVAYAEYGKSARYAPIRDYSRGVASANGVSSTTSAPTPTILHAYTAGLRYDTPRLYLNVDAYYQKLNDDFSFYTNYQTGVSNYANTGSSQYRGWEMSGKWRATPSIEFFGNASFTKANYLASYYADADPFNDQFGYVFRGEPLAAIPKWNGTFGVDYTHGPFSARFTGEYTGQQVITYDLPPVLPNNPQVAPPNPNSTLALATTPYVENAQANLGNSLGGYPKNPHFRLPGYLINNLLLSYKLPLNGYGRLQYLKFDLNVQNLLNLHYYQYYLLAPAELPDGKGGFLNTPTYAQAYTGIPRSIYLSVTARF